MLRKLVIILMLVVCCYCEENSTAALIDEGRAKKLKKKTFRLLAMVAIFILSKIAIVKMAAFFFLYTFFQKIFSIGGLLLTYFMKAQLGMALPISIPSPSPSPSPAPPAPAVVPPSTSYGSPTDYNTIGYSYGPPEHEAAFQSEPSLPDVGGPFNWILHKP